MCKFLPFTHFYGLVIVPVLAMMLAFPASAQISSNSESPKHRRHPHQHRQIQTKNDGFFRRGGKIRLAGINWSSRIFNSIRNLYCHLYERNLVQQGMGQRPHASFYFL